MSKPKRITLSRKKGWKMPPNCVKVDRSTPFGNPFIVDIHGTAEECIEYFRLWISHWSKSPLPKQSQPDNWLRFQRNIDKLRGKDLACWCKEDAAACHADVLIEFANKEDQC